MTLVVARCEKGRIAIAADTLLTEHEAPLPFTKGVVKSCCLPGYLCASFCGSPELAGKAFKDFAQQFPTGTGFDQTIKFFERSSSSTGNDYIIAFGANARLVTIKEGRRTRGLSKTHWIGDQDAYTRFREYEAKRRERHEHQRAVNVAMFADEMKGSPASDLYSTMRNLVFDRAVPTVGGFVTVLGNRDIGFRYSVYSDVLYDWPIELEPGQDLALTDKVDLRASGENDRYSVSQISPGYYNMNIVAFYLLKAKLLVVYHSKDNGVANDCSVFRGVEPQQIAATLNEKLGFNFGALCMVMSGRSEYSRQVPRTDPSHGLGISMFCEANTMPKAEQSVS